jgi:uncharacterized coiled-coil protein SlyX
MSDDSRLVDRVTDLEALFMHLDETVKALDGVVRAQQKSLDTLTGRVARLTMPTPPEDDVDSSP